MASLKRQITDLEKQQVMEQQRRSGVLYMLRRRSSD